MLAVLASYLLSLVQPSWITSYRIAGNSMLPTYTDGDRVTVITLPWFLLALADGDAVIAEVDGTALIKRVAALPGETIEIRASHLIREGRLVDEPIPEHLAQCPDVPQQTLRSDELFLLGDHRRTSIDSRSFGPVRRAAVIGKVLFRQPANATFPE